MDFSLPFLKPFDAEPAPRLSDAKRRHGGAALRTEILSGDAFARRALALRESPQGAGATAFQGTAWLEHWYATLGRQPGLSPVRVAVVDVATGCDRMLLPLVAQRGGGVTWLRAPDGGVADYQFPIVCRRWRPDGDDLALLWPVLKRQLAGHGDVLRLAKMLPAHQDLAHPLLAVLPSWPSESLGHPVDLSQGHAAWLNTLSRQARREFARHWRVFQGHSGASFVRARSLAEAWPLLDALERFQAERFAQQADYRLGESPYRQFYARLLASGLDEGRVVLTALRAADEIVSVAYALRQGAELTVVRLAIGDLRWKPCAPGLLLLERTAEALAAEGVRFMDLSIGSHAYKRSFGCAQRPLRETCVALSWRGQAVAAAWQARQHLAGAASGRHNPDPCRAPNLNS